MTVIITDNGFAADDWTEGFVALSTDNEAANDIKALDLASDVFPETLGNVITNVDFIRIDFPGAADGRGFTIARQLRLMGFKGRLRAKGHVLADQYAMARRSGFDEIEISDELAARQPEDQWQFRADWKAHDYQNRLRAKVTS
ncbi:MAG: DUF934 domain-containing protein [Cognatishimia sp.]|uniref:DUF934 domain-containing protein n=1 Tax=Cognatishimia sp. TaxID=2211648 RepID=UPI003B8DCE81